MRAFGILLLIAGVIGALFALNMDVSVSTAFGTVNNIGLMQDRQNYLIISGIAVLAGILMMIFGGAWTEIGDVLADPFADPFEVDDRVRLVERQRYAHGLGVTRVEGVYHFDNVPCDSLEDAIKKAQAKHNTTFVMNDGRDAELGGQAGASGATMDKVTAFIVGIVILVGFVAIVLSYAK